MDINDLKEYLGMVVDVEKDCYFQDKLRQGLEENISALKKPQPIKIDPPKSKVVDAVFEGIVNGIGSGIFVGGIIGFFVGAFLNGVVIGALVGVVICLIWVLSERNTYRKALDAYQQTIQEDKKRIQVLLQRYENVRSYFISEISAVNSRQEQSKRFLQELYQANVIFPKYRNLIMVSSLYEYFCSGRCATLEGRDGAYNILELEVRADHIIFQLDQIVSQLDSIQKNQYMLYCAIKETNQRLANVENSNRQLVNAFSATNYNISQLNTEINRLRQTSQITLYYAERAQVELEYMNRMNFFAGKYDDAGFFLRRPPI